MKAILLIIAFSLIHFLLLAGFFIIGIIAQGGLLAETEVSGKLLVSEICKIVTQILAFPLFSSLNMVKQPLPDLLEWFAVALNSLLYGTGTLGIVKLLGRK